MSDYKPDAADLKAAREYVQSCDNESGSFLSRDLQVIRQRAFLNGLGHARREWAEERAALLARRCSHGPYKLLGTDGCASCYDGRVEIYYLERECLSCRTKRGDDADPPVQWNGEPPVPAEGYKVPG